MTLCGWRVWGGSGGGPPLTFPRARVYCWFRAPPPRCPTAPPAGPPCPAPTPARTAGRLAAGQQGGAGQLTPPGLQYTPSPPLDPQPELHLLCPQLIKWKSVVKGSIVLVERAKKCLFHLFSRPGSQSGLRKRSCFLESIILFSLNKQTLI